MLHRRLRLLFYSYFRTFEARARANITGLELPTNSPLTLVSQQKSCKVSGAISLGREAIEPARKSLVRGLRAANQIFNKTKEFFGSLKYYLRM